jgi:hypothetical protein
VDLDEYDLGFELKSSLGLRYKMKLTCMMELKSSGRVPFWVSYPRCSLGTTISDLLKAIKSAPKVFEKSIRVMCPLEAMLSS